MITSYDERAWYECISFFFAKIKLTVYVPEKEYSSIDVYVSTGDVTGTLLSDKIFFAETTTGDVSVPKLTSGGKCEISTTAGDIEISIK